MTTTDTALGAVTGLLAVGIVANVASNVMGKGIPKMDGSGRGIRANKGRGGCKVKKHSGLGRNKFINE